MSKAINLPKIPLTKSGYNSRKTVQTFQKQSGKIIKIDAVNFGIEDSSAAAVLMPVNLPVSFEKEGMKIIFSGMVKEINLNEMMAGQPIVLTYLQEK